MSISKKITAGLLALAMIFSFTACTDTSWAAKVDSYQVNAGIYIYYTMLAYSEAQSKAGQPEEDASAAETTVAETTAETTTGTTSEKELFDAKIEGKSVKTWIEDYATDKVKEFVAVEKKFDELGLTLSDAENRKINSNLEGSWESNSKIFEKNGISKDSLKLIIQMNFKNDLIFDSYYKAGGSEEVPQEDINNYYNDNNMRVKYIAIQLKDGEGNLFKSADKAKAMEMAEDYKARAEEENFDDLIKDYNDYYAKVVADAAADDSSSSSSSSSEDSAAEEEKDPYANEQILLKDGTVPSEKVNKAIFEKCKVGEVTIVEDDEVYYVVQRLDLLERTDLLESNLDSILYTLKGDEFTEKMKEYADSLEVSKNESSYKRYNPEKLYFGEDEE